MVKVEVIEKFNFKKYNELKDIKRKEEETPGVLYVGDIFECTEEMANYLIRGNALKRPVVKVIEENQEEVEKTLKKSEKKEIKKPIKRKVSSRKKTIEKKAKMW